MYHKLSETKTQRMNQTRECSNTIRGNQDKDVLSSDFKPPSTGPQLRSPASSSLSALHSPFTFYFLIISKTNLQHFLMGSRPSHSHLCTLKLWPPLPSRPTWDTFCLVALSDSHLDTAFLPFCFPSAFLLSWGTQLVPCTPWYSWVYMFPISNRIAGSVRIKTIQFNTPFFICPLVLIQHFKHNSSLPPYCILQALEIGC